MVKASLCAGFYPNILRAEHPAQRYKQVEAGTMASDAAPQEIRFFDRQRGRVFLHPSSANFNCGRFESNWLVFTEMVETSKAGALPLPAFQRLGPGPIGLAVGVGSIAMGKLRRKQKSFGPPLPAALRGRT